MEKGASGWCRPRGCLELLHQKCHRIWPRSAMTFILFSLSVSAAFFISSLVLLNYGRYLGLRYLRQDHSANLGGLTTIEGAVFALVGLLVAFTVSGALHRFDERRQLVIQEANAISTAYDRLGFLDGEGARTLQAALKDYVRARIELYRMPNDFSVWTGTEVWSQEQQDKTQKLKTATWNAMAAACPPTNFRASCALALTGLNSAFEAARARAGAAEKHPPQIIYIVLFGLGLGSSLLAGFSMAAAKSRSWIHMITFAAALTLTLYLITDLEFPRLGFVDIATFDHFLIDVHHQMQ